MNFSCAVVKNLTVKVNRAEITFYFLFYMQIFKRMNNNIIGLYEHKSGLPHYKDDTTECKMK